jgi:phosphate:Na+ symporter
MFGMKFMSDGLERSAGKGMRRLLGRITNNRFAGVGIGAAVTGIIQSSAATTVMVMGFVNAGLMTLAQATAIIMGANIGTTVTGFLVSLSAVGSTFTAVLGIFVFVGAFMVLFLKKEKYKRIGSILGGLGMIFIGLELMSGAFGQGALSDAMIDVFTSINFPLLLILVGFAFTALIQSSSAVTGILVTMIGASALPLDCAMFIVLGTNIGSCVTALIAAIGADTNAKRVAVIHLTDNIVGTIIFTAVIWPLSDKVVALFQTCFPQPQLQVAMFHFFFNLITTAILLPFIKLIVRFAEFVVRDKRGSKDEAPHMYYIDDRFLQTPPIAVAQVKREVDHMGEMAKSNLKRAMTAVLTSDLGEREAVLKDEERINYINKGVAKYLIKLSSQSLSRTDEKFVGSLFHVINDMERIADYAKNFFDDISEMVENDCAFTQQALDELEDMYAKVMAMFDSAMYIFANNAVGKLNELAEREREIDMTKRLLGNNHIARLNAGGCSVEGGTHFYSMISALERIADHLTNIAFSIKSPSGSQREAMEKIAEEQRRRTRERKHNGESLQKPDVASAEAAATTEDNDGDVGGGGR